MNQDQYAINVQKILNMEEFWFQYPQQAIYAMEVNKEICLKMKGLIHEFEELNKVYEMESNK